VRALACTLVLLTAFPALAGNETLPQQLDVRVGWGHPRGPTGLRSDLEQEIIAVIRAAGCYSEVRRLPPEAEPRGDLILHVTLDEYAEEDTYNTSLAEQKSPDAQRDVAKQRLAEVRSVVDLELLSVRDDGLRIRGRRTRQNASHRPNVSEDPLVYAKEEWLEQVARLARKYACGLSASELLKELDQARKRAAKAGAR